MDSGDTFVKFIALGEHSMDREGGVVKAGLWPEPRMDGGITL